jgi:hypothetical protein
MEKICESRLRVGYPLSLFEMMLVSEGLSSFQKAQPQEFEKRFYPQNV